MAADPYTTLGVARGASEAEIKKAYRALAKQHHPDRNKDNPASADRFAKATAAYDLLTDADKRARFDRGEIDGDGNPASPFGFGQGGGGFRPGPGGFSGAPEGVDFGDIFDGLFGGAGGQRGPAGFGNRAAPPPRGANVNYRLAVTFEEAATLTPQRVTLQDGKTIDIKLPPGVETGTQMRLAGKGQTGPGGAGDASLTVEIGAHRFFVREGDDIRLDLPVTLSEAVLGASVRVPTVDGPVMLTIPKGSTTGKALRIKGRGFTGKAGARGNQIVTLQIDLPAGDEALERFATEWEDTRNPRGSLGV